MTKHLRIRYVHFLFLVLFFHACASKKRKSVSNHRPNVEKTTMLPVSPSHQVEKAKERSFVVHLPEIKREFRAAWVATVANINWPSKKNLSTEEQKQEAVRILDQLKAAHFNAVIFQARPSSDALYKSDLEPWSYFLTGHIGKAPSPFYDPLEFWIEQAHARGMELHVWLNPYRAHHTSGGAVTAESMVNRFSEQTYRLKNGMYWMDPSDEKVQNHVSSIIKDIVKRYDIDAVHIDDYFYPYKDYHGGKDFPDNKTWNAYKNSGGHLSKADWRRNNVNTFIKRIHTEIKAQKKHVKFGISPFGIWKPGYPAGIIGSSQYDELYADAKLWLNEGWCDYYAPQLYWKDGGAQSFSALLQWWEEQNHKKVHLWPGLNTVAIRGVPSKTEEITKQILKTRNLLGNRAGEIHYSMDGISKNPAMFQTLKQIYAEKALVPGSPWIKAEVMMVPEITAKKVSGQVALEWFSRTPKAVRQWILYTQYGNYWHVEILEPSVVKTTIPFLRNNQKLKAVAIKSVDRLANESDYKAIKITE